MKTKPLPEGWQEVELKEVAEVNDRDHYTPKYENEGVPIISPKDFREHGINFDSLKYVSEEEYEKFVKKCSPTKGDLLYSRIGTIGVPKIIDFNFRFVALHSIAVIKPDRKVLLSGFLFYLLRSSKLQNQAKLGTKSIGTPDLGLNVIRSFKIPLPPLDVQKKIVAVLEKAEKAKELRKEADELTKEFLKAVFMEMFGEYIHDEKKQAEVKDICFVKGGKRLPKGELFSNTKTPRPYIRVTDMMNLSINTDKLKYITEDLFKKIKNYTISKEDVYITIAGTTGLTGTIPEELDRASLTENAAKLVIKDQTKLDKLFLAYILSTDYCQSQLEKNTYQVGVPKLALFRIETSKIPLPPLTLQQKFASIVEQVEKMKEQQKHSKEQIDNLFNALMQKAFKGELTI